MPLIETNRNEEDGIFTFVWERSGRRIQLDSIHEAHADAVHDILLLKEAIDAGLDPGDLHLRILNGPPISALPSAAAREEITAVPFEQLAEQLQGCTRLLSMLPLQELQGRPRTEAAQLLLLAAFRGHTHLLRLLLLLTAPTAFLDTPELMPELFKEAYLVFGHEDSTASPFSMGWSPLHTAAAGGSVACATALLEADACLAAIATMGGWRPAHVAAWHGRTDVLRLLLATAPETAQASDFDGYLPIHCAALGGRQGCVQLLVAADPASLMATTGMGETALHLASACQQPRDASDSSHAAVVQQLLELHPGTVLMHDAAGRLPLGCCAASEHGSPAVFNMLLRAYPEGLHVRDETDGQLPTHMAAEAGNLDLLRLLHTLAPQTFMDATPFGRLSPMHYAARGGRPEAVSFLLETEPASASLVTEGGKLPLSTALLHIPSILPRQQAPMTAAHVAVLQRYLEAVRRLLPAVPAATALSALAGAHERTRQLFPDAVVCHLPLSAAEWSLVPEPCPELERALPAALRHSHEQARQVVRRLSQADRARLRTAALCMVQVQTLACASLPPALFERLLAQSLAE